jgi:hypothetical protein
MKTVADLNLSPELVENACFLLNYRTPGMLLDAYPTNLHSFTTGQLRTALEHDAKLTAENPKRLKKTAYFEDVCAELKAILDAAEQPPQTLMDAWVFVSNAFFHCAELHELAGHNVDEFALSYYGGGKAVLHEVAGALKHDIKNCRN